MHSALLLSRLSQMAGLAGVGLIVVLSLVPGDAQVRTPAPKELEHFAAYLCTAAALGFGYWGRHRMTVVVIGLCLLAGAAELAQAGVPGRTPKIFDAAASSAGAVLGLALAILARRALRRREAMGG
jgi:VanZ family protein